MAASRHGNAHRNQLGNLNQSGCNGRSIGQSTDFLLKEVAKFAFAQTCLPVEAMLERPMQRRRVALNIDAAPHYQDKRDEA
jgi:hypothetical protein